MIESTRTIALRWPVGDDPAATGPTLAEVEAAFREWVDTARTSYCPDSAIVWVNRQDPTTAQLTVQWSVTPVPAEAPPASVVLPDTSTLDGPPFPAHWTTMPSDDATMPYGVAAAPYAEDGMVVADRADIGEVWADAI